MSSMGKADEGSTSGEGIDDEGDEAKDHPASQGDIQSLKEDIAALRLSLRGITH